MNVAESTISKQGKNILECKVEAYISKASGLIPAKTIPARWAAIKKTKTNPLQD